MRRGWCSRRVRWSASGTDTLSRRRPSRPLLRVRCCATGLWWTGIAGRGRALWSTRRSSAHLLDHGRQFGVPDVGRERGVEFLAVVSADVRRLGRRGVDDHLVADARRLPGGTEQVDRQVRHDRDVAVRVDLDRHGPHDLVEVEGVDVLVDDDDDAGVPETVRRGEEPHTYGLGETAVAGLGRHHDDQAVGVEGVDRLHLGEVVLELRVDRRAGGHRLQVVQLGPRPADVHRVVYRVLPVQYAVDLDHRVEVATRVVPGELTEGPLDFALPRENPPFEHVLGTPWHVQPLIRLGDAVGLALHGAGHLVLELVVQHRGSAHQRDGRLVAQGDGDRQVLAAGLGVGELDRAVVLGNALQTEPVAVLDL